MFNSKKTSNKQSTSNIQDSNLIIDNVIPDTKSLMNDTEEFNHINIDNIINDTNIDDISNNNNHIIDKKQIKNDYNWKDMDESSDSDSNYAIYPDSD